MGGLCHRARARPAAAFRLEVLRALARVLATAPPWRPQRRVPGRYGPDFGGIQVPSTFCSAATSLISKLRTGSAGACCRASSLRSAAVPKLVAIVCTAAKREVRKRDTCLSSASRSRYSRLEMLWVSAAAGRDGPGWRITFRPSTARTRRAASHARPRDSNSARRRSAATIRWLAARQGSRTPQRHHSNAALRRTARLRRARASAPCPAWNHPRDPSGNSILRRVPVQFRVVGSSPGGAWRPRPGRNGTSHAAKA